MSDMAPTIDFLREPVDTDAPTTSIKMEIDPDRLFDGRFRIRRLVGQGGMGTVYEVEDFLDGESLALKVLLKKLMESRGAVERFRREVEIASRIQHPAVPKIKAWGNYRGEYYYASEFISGSNLAIRMKRDGAWDSVSACRLVARVADALHVAHRAGIIHRDVKPQNIMLSEAGTVHLVDFGVARGPIGDMKTITTTGMIIGTPEYMAPEQLDSHRVDRRCDIYSLGVVLFELLTGSRPFSGTTPFEVALKHKNTPPPRPRAIRSDIPLWIDRVVIKCLEKNPEDRFSTAAELRDLLKEAHPNAKSRKRQLASGDVVVEREPRTSEWPLVLYSRYEKHDWEPGLALRFDDGFFKLAQIIRPNARVKKWTYKFQIWDEHEIFRKMLDYDSDCVAQAVKRRKFGNFMRRLVGLG